MKFLFPQFLWALFAIAIPIIIHLFNFRRFKKIYFSDLQLLKEVELETNKKSKVKHFLILLARIFTIASLVFAFAQPYFPKNNQENQVGEKYISVYIDNSFSMNAIGEEVPLLELAKEQAIAIANKYKPSDNFQLLTNDFETKHQRFGTKQEFLENIEEITSSSITKNSNQVQQKQIDLLKTNNNGSKNAYFISDFQKSTSPLSLLVKDSSINSFFVHLTSVNKGNVFIDTVWFETPIRVLNKKEDAKVKITNHTDENIQVKVELIINEITQGYSDLVELEANSSKVTTLSYLIKEEGIVNAKIKISEYPNPIITFDDSYYFSYNLKKSAEVLCLNSITNTKTNINQLFQNDTYFKLKNTSAKAIDFSEFGKYNLIILNGLNEISSGLNSEILKYLSSGGNVLVFPGEKLKINSFNEFLLSINAGRLQKLDTTSTKVSYLNYQHPLYKNVFEKTPKNIDLPKVYKSYRLSVSSRSKVEKIMKLQTGNDFLAKFNYKKGNVYLFTVPLNSEFSNLTNHSIFVTSILKIAENSGFKSQTNFTISSDNISIKDENYQLENIHIVNQKENIDFIPEGQRNRGELKLFLPKTITQSGNYIIKNNNINIGGFGLNYDRKESDFETYTSEELKKEIENDFMKIISIDNDSTEKSTTKLYDNDFKYWKLFIILALIFVAIEIILIKLMK